MGSIPRTYAVVTNNDNPAVLLGAPVMRALDAEKGDTVLVTEAEDGVNVRVVD